MHTLTDGLLGGSYMPLTGGEQFAGYRILRMIGSGGMGEIYLAQHPRLPRHDALKVLPAHMSSDTAFRDRFSREADLASSLFHPHIVGVHDRGEDRGQLWIAMDYIDGTDAGRLVREHYPSGLPAGEVIEIVSAIGEALDYAHTRGLLHRDVKPGNILLANPVAGRRRILLADFGIARAMEDSTQLTRTNMALGTVHYASPEQLRNQHLDGRTDQYSLAATAFELLTGRAPFDDPSAAVVMSQHLTAAPPSLAATRPDLAALDVPFAVALSKFPGERFPRCEDFVQSLQSHLQHGRRGTRALAATPAPRAAPAPMQPAPQRKTPALLWPLAIGAVVAVVILAALIITAQSDSDDTATPPVTIPPSTSTSSTTSATETSTTGFDAMSAVVTDYYAQLPDDTADAWNMLGDSYQAETGGRREYQSFWSSIRSVSVDSVSPRDSTSVSAQLTYTMRNGSTSSERRWFEIDDTGVISDSGLG